tara:strand:- start:7552 stop:8550 length:999 start_codon:yes stop_codon:yes gene_type:complete
MSLEAFRFALPSKRESASDIAAQTGADEAFIQNKVGLSYRHILSGEETGIGLATNACRELLESHDLDVSEIDLLICVTQTPDRQLPQNSAGIASALNLPQSTAAFDIALGCSGFVYAMQVAVGFLRTCGMNKAIVVTCDPYSRNMAAEDKSTNCVFGDAAAATLIVADSARSQVIAFSCGTDGSRGDAISIAAGGANLPLVHLTDSGTDTAAYERDQARLKMNGRGVFNFVLSTVPDSIRECLDKAGMDLQDIDYFALHQGSMFMLDALAKNMGIPQEKVLKNMENYGNTVSSTIPMLLSDLDHDRKLSGSTVLMSGFGVGLSWATAIVKFN